MLCETPRRNEKHPRRGDHQARLRRRCVELPNWSRFGLGAGFAHFASSRRFAARAVSPAIERRQSRNPGATPSPPPNAVRAAGPSTRTAIVTNGVMERGREAPPPP